MAKVGLFFATDTGNTRKVAKMIKKQFEEGEIQLYNVTKATAEELQQYDSLIFGTPTLGDGELPDTLLEFMPTLESVSFSGKTVALYGLGDQEGYPDEFVDALGILYKKLKKLGATFVGSWPNDGYEFEKSKALVDDAFVGLVIDQDNQADLTGERVEEWLEQVKPLLLKEAVAG
ncbi:MAG: flavodoxin [Gammaproteobacteria bacterium]|nr:flavodoxin [Gammaproteobacteria bacterium]MCP5425831.1 flavodoxin [Gammaproteobacteria bacterium]MCP5458559.1 flavodoxin [Gammaproteobacteria bacterium]